MMGLFIWSIGAFKDPVFVIFIMPQKEKLFFQRVTPPYISYVFLYWLNKQRKIIPFQFLIFYFPHPTLSILFYRKSKNLCIPVILVQTSKKIIFVIICSWYKEIHFQCIHCKNHWVIVVRVHIPRSALIHTLFICLFL